jgi:hypothetical protein
LGWLTRERIGISEITRKADIMRAKQNRRD